MGRVTGCVKLAGVGVLSAAVYAAAVPLSARLGLEPVRLHLPVFGVAVTLYLLALWLVARGAAAGRGALGIILGFALVFRILMLWTPVYLSSDPYRYLWDGRVQWAGVNPYPYPPAAPQLSTLRDLHLHPHLHQPPSAHA